MLDNRLIIRINLSINKEQKNGIIEKIKINRDFKTGETSPVYICSILSSPF